MNIDRQLDDMSREQLYSLIKELREENTSQKTELTKYKQLTDDYQKYFDEINETFVSKTKVIQKDISNKKKELDSLKTLSTIESQSNGESNEQISDEKQTNIRSQSGKQTIEKKDRLQEMPQISVKKKIKREKTDEEEVPELSSTKSKRKSGLNSKIIKAKINDKKTNSFEGTDNQSVVKNMNKSDDNSNECKPRIDCITGIKTEPNCVESEDSDIEFIDIPKKESELVEICDTSDEESKETEKQTQSDEQTAQTSSQYPKQCEWKGCSYLLSFKEEERYHLNKHMGKYRCDVCGYISGNCSHLKKQRDVKHSNVLTFVCPLNDCKEIFKSEVLLRTHLKYVHKLFENNSNETLNPQKKQMSDNSNENIEQNFSQKRRRSDDNCDTNNPLKIQRTDNSKKMTESKDNTKSNDSLRFIYKCPLKECSLLFKYSNFVRHHLFNDHQLIGLYWDKKISRSKKDINLYSDQQLANLRGGYVCDYNGCGIEFKTFQEFITHSESHGQEYKCCWPNCTAVFSAQILLSRHINIHKRTYKCNWKGCDYIGRDEWCLRKHEELHSIDNNF